MEVDIVRCHEELQEYIHAVEEDETNREALRAVKTTFLSLFDMIKLIMISKQDRYYGCFLMNFDLNIDFTSYHDASVSLDAFPFRMTVNPLLIGLKALPEIIYIICHEIEHIVLNHPADGIKYNPPKDPSVAFKLNIAMDASINDRLTADSREHGFTTIAPPDSTVTSAVLSKAYNIHIKSMQAFDYYFSRIPDGGSDGGSDDGILKTPLPLIVRISDRREIITEPKRKNRIPLPCWTVIRDPDEVAALIRRFVLNVCDGMPDTVRGKLPEQQTEALRRLLTPPTISWERLLKRYVGTVPDGQRKTRLRLNRRQPERYDISGSIRDRIIKLVVAIDTSGSMSAGTLERIMAEIFDIVGTRSREITVIECDAEIQRVYRVQSAGDVSCDLHGRGGTSFIPVIDYLNSDRYFRDAILIYFTDGVGDASIPQPRTLRTIWVLHDKHCALSLENPYGEVLSMEK